MWEHRLELNCPVCSAPLTLDDALAKKLVRCPKCEQSFVVPAVQPLSAQVAREARDAATDDFELSPSSDQAAQQGPTDADSLKFCPGCGAEWKKGQRECKKCNYLPAVGAQLRPKDKAKLDLRMSLQNVYLVIFLGAAGYGVYYAYEHWNTIKAAVNSIWAHG